ncbi:MAG: protein translocase subunit SecF, partial [Oscillospiraceae bacterium]
MKKKTFNIDFIGNSKRYLIISLAIIALGILFTIFAGVKLDIEFVGGTMLSYVYDGEISPDDFKASVQEALGGAEVAVNTGSDFTTGRNKLQVEINAKNELNSDGQFELTNKLDEIYSENNLELIQSSDVSAASGKTFFLKCLVAVVFSSVVLIIYIAIRFKNIGGWLAGVCAVIALFHD